MTVWVFLFTALFLVGITQEAFAYLDAGTGSMVLQAIVGAIAGGLVVLKIYWARIKGFFSASKRDEKSEENG